MCWKDMCWGSREKSRKYGVFFLMEKNRNYKTNFYFVCYIVFRVLWHSLAIEWNSIRVGIFIWYLGMFYQLRTDPLIVTIEPSVRVLEELKLVCSITVPHNLWGYFLRGDWPLPAPSLTPSSHRYSLHSRSLDLCVFIYAETIIW